MSVWGHSRRSDRLLPTSAQTQQADLPSLEWVRIRHSDRLRKFAGKRQQDQLLVLSALAHRAGSPRSSKINDLARSGKPKRPTVFQGILSQSFPPKRYLRDTAHHCSIAAIASGMPNGREASNPVLPPCAERFCSTPMSGPFRRQSSLRIRANTGRQRPAGKNECGQLARFPTTQIFSFGWECSNGEMGKVGSRSDPVLAARSRQKIGTGHSATAAGEVVRF